MEQAFLSTAADDTLLRAKIYYRNVWDNASRLLVALACPRLRCRSDPKGVRILQTGPAREALVFVVAPQCTVVLPANLV